MDRPTNEQNDDAIEVNHRNRKNDSASENTNDANFHQSSLKNSIEPIPGNTRKLKLKKEVIQQVHVV